MEEGEDVAEVTREGIAVASLREAVLERVLATVDQEATRGADPEDQTVATHLTVAT